MADLYDMLNKGEIVIPIIQRDYAQGRENSESTIEIGRNFVSDMLTTLFKGNRMKLGFVFGAKEGNRFVPYDGQQRLTLVFLVALYMTRYSSGTGKCITPLNKFSYETRDFSTAFCAYITGDAFLKGKDFKEVVEGNGADALKSAIMDDRGFFSAWIRDPTVSSMINVLQIIREKFDKLCIANKVADMSIAAQDIAEKITRGDVFFDWCEIAESDRVYVKMNGRGKVLSAYDNFKDTLFRVLKAMRDVHDAPKDAASFLREYELKTDSTWTDLFWTYREDVGSSVGDRGKVDIAGAMMNFFSFAFEYKLNARTGKFFIDGRNPQFNDTNVVRFIAAFKCMSPTLDDYVWVSKLLDILSVRMSNADGYEKQLFVGICTGDNYYRTRIEAAFYYDCLVSVSAFDSKGTYQSVNDGQKGEWRRFLTNMMETTKYFTDGHYDYLLIGQKSIYRAYEKILRGEDGTPLMTDGDITSRLSDIYADEALRTGIKAYLVAHTDGQFEEECLKSSLIKEDDTWKEAIVKADNIPYFGGQVYFLLKAAQNANGEYEVADFTRLLDAAEALVNKSTRCLCDSQMWQILLSLGDYRLCNGNAYTICSSKIWNNDAPMMTLWRTFFDVLNSEKTKSGKSRSEFIKGLLSAISDSGNDIEKAAAKCKQKMTGRYDWMSTLVMYPEVLRHIGAYKVIDTDTWGCYIVTSNAGYIVRRDTRDNSVNIDVYRIYRELGFGSDASFYQQGEYWESGTDPGAKSIKQTGQNKYRLTDAGGTYEGTVENVIKGYPANH